MYNLIYWQMCASCLKQMSLSWFYTMCVQMLKNMKWLFNSLHESRTIDKRVGASSQIRVAHAAQVVALTHSLQNQKYEVFDILGEGAQGIVWHCQDRETKVDVAIKQLEMGNMAQCLLQKRIEHPNVNRLIDVFTDEQNHYCLILEFLPGVDLIEYLHSAKPCIREATHVAIDIFNGIRHCHDRNVCHRDIKLQNICLQPASLTGHPPRPVVVDFGLAADSSVLLTQSCGTLLYTAPEVYMYKPILYDGQQADIWSCGILLFAVLRRELPFQSLAELRKYQRKPSIKGILRLPASYQDTVIQMLSIIPNLRLGIAPAVSQLATHLQHTVSVAV